MNSGQACLGGAAWKLGTAEPGKKISATLNE